MAGGQAHSHPLLETAPWDPSSTRLPAACSWLVPPTLPLWGPREQREQQRGRGGRSCLPGSSPDLVKEERIRPCQLPQPMCHPALGVPLGPPAPVQGD